MTEDEFTQWKAEQYARWITSLAPEAKPAPTSVPSPTIASVNDAHGVGFDPARRAGTVVTGDGGSGSTLVGLVRGHAGGGGGSSGATRVTPVGAMGDGCTCSVAGRLVGDAPVELHGGSGGRSTSDYETRLRVAASMSTMEQYQQIAEQGWQTFRKSMFDDKCLEPACDRLPSHGGYCLRHQNLPAGVDASPALLRVIVVNGLDDESRECFRWRLVRGFLVIAGCEQPFYNEHDCRTAVSHDDDGVVDIGMYVEHREDATIRGTVVEFRAAAGLLFVEVDVEGRRPPRVFRPHMLRRCTKGSP